MWVDQLGNEIDLSDEPLPHELVGELRVEHFDGDGAARMVFLRQVDGGHAALAKHPLDGVPVCQGGSQTVKSIGHRP